MKIKPYIQYKLKWEQIISIHLSEKIQLPNAPSLLG